MAVRFAASLMAEILVALVVVVGAIVVHELAHVVATKAVGHEIFEIQIGSGPQWSFRIAGIDVHLGAIPLGGHVQTGARSGDGFRWRTAVVAGAGIAANAVLTVVGLATGIAPMIVFNGLAVVANLWPGGRRRLGDPSSDGRLLLDLARNDEDVIAEERSGWHCTHAMQARDAGDLAEARRLVDDGRTRIGDTRALTAVAGVIAFEQQRFADVVAAYATLIGDDRVSVAGRAGFAADAAWAASLSDDPDLRRLAHPWAAFALGFRPKITRRRVVLALALVDAGAPDEARRTLGDLDTPTAAAVRALALAASGDVAGARAIHHNEVAPGMEAEHPLTKRVAAAVHPSQDR